MRTGALLVQGAGSGAVPAQLAVGEPTGVGPPAELVAVAVLAGELTAAELLTAADRAGVLVGPATPAGTVRITVRLIVTVLLGPETVLVGPGTVTVTVARTRTGRAAGAAIGRVEAAGSEWPAPPITTPASSPAAAASVTGRRHQFPGASVPNMASG